MATESLRRPLPAPARMSVRVDRDTYDRLVELSREANIPLTRLIARALDVYDRVTMAEESNAAYARMREDPDAWADWQSELTVWGISLLDGRDAAGSPARLHGYAGTLSPGAMAQVARRLHNLLNLPRIP